MDITEQVRIAAPLDRVWPLLRDPQTVVACIPGAQLAQGGGEDGVWRGAIRVKFGPTVAAFRGEARLEFDDAAHRCTIEGRGVDQRGASRALAQGAIAAEAEGPAATLLTVQGGFSVTGPLETFANAGGVHVARALLADFAANMSKLVAERQPTPAPPEATSATPAAAEAPMPAPPPPPAPAREIGGLGLLWRAFLSWLRSLLGR